ncbi:Glutamyl-tRNA reductase [Candidatus Magnetaquicoccaceae bacterium FCR-1]|uniref:Glutamyl-tRNA reductase n=1 Tax=Candidatus Magnetaquiglobus chichijimensis TaxID=3141448 RepID=A0ABQ0CC96_9PROT
MKIVIVGLSHKTAPVAVRERLAFSNEELPGCLAELRDMPGLREVALLSTCNRVEIYAAGPQPDKTAASIRAWLVQNRALEAEQLEAHLYQLDDRDAVRHGFRVAASLDSLVVGEAQILGQMKQAYQLANEAATSGAILEKFFQHAFHAAKQVRNETGIARNPVSIASAAVSLARRIFGDLKGCRCLLIGAGEMCELAARHLVTDGVSILVANRTLSRAVALADAFGGDAFVLSDLEAHLDKADIILSSTGATGHVVTASMIKAALKKRRQKPQFLIDIAVPRDLDPAIGDLDNAYLYDIDDLTRIVENNLKDRGREMTAAEVIVEQRCLEFMRWLETLDLAPVLTALREKLEGIRDQEVARTLASWPDISPDEQKRIEQLGRLLVNKILHAPLSRLRHLAAEPDGDLYVDAARQLFQLDRT